MNDPGSDSVPVPLGPDAEKSVVLKSVTKDLVSYFLSKGIKNYTAPADIDWVRAEDPASRNTYILSGNEIPTSIPNSTGLVDDSGGGGFFGIEKNEGGFLVP